MPTLRTSTGAGLHYEDVGSGPTLLALHGGYSTLAEVRGFLGSSLTARRVLYVDLPGMGESTAEGIENVAGVCPRWPNWWTLWSTGSRSPCSDTRSARIWPVALLPSDRSR